MQHKAAQGTKWQDLINKVLTRLEAPGLRPQSACLEEIQENELRMLSTDTNTISTTLPSPSLPRLRPRDILTLITAEDTLQSLGSPGQAAHWEELVLPSQAWQCCLCKQPGPALHSAGKQHTSLHLFSTLSAQSTALG